MGVENRPTLLMGYGSIGPILETYTPAEDSLRLFFL